MGSKRTLICRVLLRRFPVASILLGVALVLSACDTEPQETDLQFEPIERMETSGTGILYEEQMPGIMVVSDANGASTLMGLVTDEAKGRLRAIDYDEYFALVVFQGWKPTGGYNVEVNRIARLGNDLNVYAQFNEPKPDGQRTEIVTSPYHLLQVNKTGLRGQDITINLIVNQTVVLSRPYTTPLS